MAYATLFAFENFYFRSSKFERMLTCLFITLSLHMHRSITQVAVTMHDSFENQTDFHRKTICSLLILDTSLFWRLLCLFIVNSITTRHGGVEVKMYSIGTFLFAKVCHAGSCKNARFSREADWFPSRNDVFTDFLEYVCGLESIVPFL
jgi:hypothetical protein